MECESGMGVSSNQQCLRVRAHANTLTIGANLESGRLEKSEFLDWRVEEIKVIGLGVQFADVYIAPTSILLSVLAER